VTIWKATAFEPFGGLRRNPSMDVLRGIASVRPAAAGPVLPVTWDAATTAGAALFAEHVRLAVHIGVAASRDAVCLEQVARNAAFGVDNAQVDRDEPLDEGPDRVLTGLDLDGLLALLHARWAGPSRVSRDCGRFICNATLRSSLEHAGPGRSAVFVHVPMLSPEQGVALGIALCGAFDAFTRTW